MTTLTSWRSLRLAFIALIVGALAFAGLAMPSSAEENNNPGIPAAASANIDPEAPRSLTIHKHDQVDAPLSEGQHDGSDLGITKPGLDGVTFSVRQVTDIDLTTAAGWTLAKPLTVAQARAGNLGADLGGPTNADGILSISDLPIGLYLVEETDSGAHNIVSPAAPFLVAVPQPMGAGEWLYNVHVYPKNSIADAPVKEVDDSAAHKLGDTVTWTITSQVPVMSQGNSYNSYKITDKLDGRLDYVSAAVSGAGLVEGDYTIGHNADTNTVTVALTNTGLAKINALTVAAEIKVVINTTVNSIGDGTIENTGTVFINDPNTGTSTIPVDTKWGALEITKTVEGSNELLQGAKFNLYVNTGTVDAPEKGLLVHENLTTGADGKFLVEGLKAGEYVLEETEAPAGFEKLDALIAVTIEAGSVAKPNVYAVGNVQKPPFELPLTGGMGTMTFTIAGLILLAVSGAGYLAIRKRRQL